jgi:hypothetical protein
VEERRERAPAATHLGVGEPSAHPSAGMADDDNEFVAAGAADAPELIVKEGEDIDYRVVLGFYLLADLGTLWTAPRHGGRGSGLAFSPARPARVPARCRAACDRVCGGLHFVAFPRKLEGQANSALDTAHTRRGIVPRGAGDRCWLAPAALAISVSVASRPQVQGLCRGYAGPHPTTDFLVAAPTAGGRAGMGSIRHLFNLCIRRGILGCQRSLPAP